MTLKFAPASDLKFQVARFEFRSSTSNLKF